LDFLFKLLEELEVWNNHSPSIQEMKKQTKNMYQKVRAHLLSFLGTLLQSETKTISGTLASCSTGSIVTSAMHEIILY
jgi:hypothetical protein